ncbi:tetratricopeptide repeat protein [Streptomyces sp. SID8361]|uniref:tetratricopeptide repeat protein n=1 Tax=Streptomyces sp. MnatMP-M27 TaxID=1839768 RepID=UPI000B84F914|nr:tetratricopeptide repeat protein [Streptomyces sp. SID8361]
MTYKHLTTTSRAWVHAYRGRSFHRSGHYEQAIADFTAALELNPSWALRSRGEAHRQTGHFEQAITHFTAALDRNPTHTWALGQRGVSHRQAGNYSLAREDLELHTCQQHLGFRWIR